ncbi:MAG TPA: T9SS type A sorting domain-containing protein [Chitinophagaceae bacterium]|nr:T9SS type A sorting domain-containing protein [Chitinophagaceae bacterium]
MKKIILVIAMVAIGGFFYQSHSQCTFSNFGVKVNSSYTDPTTGKCMVNFDLYFDIDHNPGGKYFWVHIWPTNAYHAPFDYKKAPTTSILPGGNGVLDGSLTTFGFWHQQGLLDPLLSYPPDPVNVPNFQSAYTITEIPGTPDRYTVTGLSLALPQGCDTAQSLSADGWESQDANATNVACSSVNQPFYVNDPATRGNLICNIAAPGVPIAERAYFFDISTISNTDMNITYNVFIDNGDGIFNAGTDTLNIKTGTVLLDATNSYKFQSGLQTYQPYSSTKPYADKSLWVVVTTPSRPNAVYALIANACTPLPVKFETFTAQRNKENVYLKWVTSSEINNKGFYIERKNSTADWQVLGFIASQAADGNSNEQLSYYYTDYNLSKDISQYRIRQVDIDNKATYTDVKLVKGFNQTGNVVVFPNPSPDGQLNIMLDNWESGATIRMIDMNGRIVKEWLNVSTNKLYVNHLANGMYTLRVWMKGTNEPLNVKVIICK